MQLHPATNGHNLARLLDPLLGRACRTPPPSKDEWRPLPIHPPPAGCSSKCVLVLGRSGELLWVRIRDPGCYHHDSQRHHPGRHNALHSPVHDGTDHRPACIPARGLAAQDGTDWSAGDSHTDPLPRQVLLLLVGEDAVVLGGGAGEQGWRWWWVGLVFVCDPLPASLCMVLRGGGLWLDLFSVRNGLHTVLQHALG